MPSDIAVLERGEVPTCARCHKPVDRVTFEDDPVTLERTYTAFCHGEAQSVRMSFETALSLARVSFGSAFDSQPSGRSLAPMESSRDR